VKVDYRISQTSSRRSGENISLQTAPKLLREECCMIFHLFEQPNQAHTSSDTPKEWNHECFRFVFVFTFQERRLGMCAYTGFNALSKGPRFITS
jgi:hypothetical protein